MSSTNLSSSTSKTPASILLLSPGDRPQVRDEAKRLRKLIEQHCPVVESDLTEEADLSNHQADLAVVIGGDGSILRAARQLGYRQIPVIGVNLGKLGFLADLAPKEFEARLPEICAGNYRVVDHLMFEASLCRDDKILWNRLGLNEVALHSGPPFSMLDVQLYVDSELVTTYACDGLIVSTPVGSTAHNLSAGGPILRKDLQAFVISPLSPHTLTNRPVVDSADRFYELVVPHPHAGTAVVVDGRVLENLLPSDRIRIHRAVPRFQLVEMSGHGYYRTLREKLGWGSRLAPPGNP